MQSQKTELHVTEELQQKLLLLQHAYRLPSTTHVLELLISTQIDQSVHAMTGIKPGPRLAVDNTKEQENR